METGAHARRTTSLYTHQAAPAPEFVWKCVYRHARQAASTYVLPSVNGPVRAAQLYGSKHLACAVFCSASGCLGERVDG